MYLVIILVLMVVLPIISILIDLAAASGAAGLLPIVAKWFVFWAAGVRLFLAGLRQTMQPSFTAATIFRIKDPAAENLVVEIGFGNLSMGLVAMLSLAFPAWLVPAGLAGGLYLGLAGIKHVLNSDRTREENIAMTSDLFAALVIAVSILGSLA